MKAGMKLNISILLQLIVGGLAMGAIYGLIGMGMNLIFNSTGGLNIAQGALVTLGAYAGVTFTVFLKLPAIPAAILTVIAMALVGSVFGFFIYEPVRFAVPTRFMLAALGAGIFITEMAQIIWGPIPYVVPRFIRKSSIRLGELVFDTQNMLILAVLLVVVAAIYLLLNRTQIGLMMRAVGQSKEVSALMGIPVRTIIRYTFALSTALATVAGVMAGPIFFVTPSLAVLMSKGFAAAVIGGFGRNVHGVIIGGLIAGVVEVFAAFFISSSYRDAWGFAFLITFLLVKPRGLFGEAAGEKA